MPKGVFEHRRRPVAERYWARVIVQDGCWGWRGYPRPGAKFLYPKIGGPDGAGCPKVFAHRVSYELHYGPIPAGLEVCHACDNPTCTNPAHLFLGTHKENFEDMMEKGRGSGQKLTSCKAGHPLVPDPRPSQSGYRWCPICRTLDMRARYLAKNGHRARHKFGPSKYGV